MNNQDMALRHAQQAIMEIASEQRRLEKRRKVLEAFIEQMKGKAPVSKYPTPTPSQRSKTRAVTTIRDIVGAAFDDGETFTTKDVAALREDGYPKSTAAALSVLKQVGELEHVGRSQWRRRISDSKTPSLPGRV